MRSRGTGPAAAAAPVTLTAVLLAGAVSGPLGGCAAPRVERSLAEEKGGNVDEARMEFWHTLPERSMISNDTAFHALLLFFEGKDPADGYAERVELLKGRGMLPASFDAPADAAVERGHIAMALVKGLEIEGGLMMRLLGPSPRYATRELEYLGFFKTGSPQQAISGAQLMGLIAQAEDYQRSKGGDDAERARSQQRSSALGAGASRVAGQPGPSRCGGWADRNPDR
jgi:hypothetical protein